LTYALLLSCLQRGENGTKIHVRWSHLGIPI
jgi:hypothetical protein